MVALLVPDAIAAESAPDRLRATPALEADVFLDLPSVRCALTSDRGLAPSLSSTSQSSMSEVQFHLLVPL